MSELVSVILAAGKGTRMKSKLPKVLHHVGGKPMIEQVLRASRIAGAKRNIVVVGFGAEKIMEELSGSVEFATQAEQLGTGHAVMQAKELVSDFDGTVMVLCGDTPLLSGGVLAKFYREHLEKNAAATVLTAVMPDPTGYGRVVRNSAGQVVKIVEQKDASPVELAVNEINTGIYCFEKKALFSALAKINCNNNQGEYYLTDVLGILVAEGAAIRAAVTDDFEQTMGINSRRQLAEAEKIWQRRRLEELMDNGVTIMDTASTFVDADVTIGQDTIIYPFTWLEGETIIGEGCQIGPNTRLENTVVGDNTILHFVYAHDCKVGNRVTVGPYVHLRPQTELADEVKIGNFAEVKNSTVGLKSKIPHLTYIGDTDMGSGVNIGSGTITVNYDGQNKHRTIIEDDAFIGCNTNLIAPVTVGKGAYVAAGSSITKDVPADSLGVARARQVNIEAWATRRKPKD
jgi:bifunctional UDP-N-acetylglucosamine pyrophosphorylase/glucosamine-1-phosphate N-acetyltransferase